MDLYLWSMSFLIRHISNILDSYEAPEPVHLALKKYYATHKQLGSRDRKAINEAVYTFFRLRSFLPNSHHLHVLQFAASRGLLENNFLQQALPAADDVPDDFEWPGGLPALSGGFPLPLYLMSLMHQPRLFIRLLKKEYLTALIDEFPDADVIYLDGLDYPIFNLPNGAKIDQLLPIDSYVVQDLSSQKTLTNAVSFLGKGHPDNIWDVCSGAGGKSILAKNIWPMAKILATDIRPQILKNLKLRAKQYELKSIETLVLDAAKELPRLDARKPEKGFPAFDLIVCDVPCSGSGTWGRTPEQIQFSQDLDLDSFQKTQVDIACNAARLLPSGKNLVYITCSVFEMENEASVREILKRDPSLKLLHQEFISGIEMAADSMFYAVFEKK